MADNPETKTKGGDKSDIKIEDVFEEIGGFGRFQKIFAFAAIFPQFSFAMITLSPIFTGSSKVPLYCNNETAFLEINNCGLDCTHPVGDEIFSSVVQEWDLVCSQSWIVDTLQSCQMAGTMAGALISSLIADHYGRKAGYYFVALGTGIGGILPSVATSPITCSMARFIAGVGNGGCFIVFLVHLMEFLTPSWRTICGCVSLFPVGEMTLGLLAYHIPNWRYLTGVSALPIFLVFLFYPFIQESPRWLLTQKKTQEAHVILTKVAKWNSRPPPTMETVEALQTNVIREEADVLKGFEGIKQIIRNKRLRIDLIILTWATVTCAVTYYGVSFSAKSLSGSHYWNMLYMGILDILGVPAVLVFNNRLGRKKTFLIYMTLASTFLVSILVMEGILGNAADYPLLITIFALLGRFGIVASWGALTCNIMETFPTSLRSTCMGFTAFAGYMGGVVAPQTVFLGNISRSIPYILYCTLTVTSLVSSLFLREMAGVPLKDTVGI